MGSPSGDDSDDAYDRLRRRVFWSMPSGLYLVGSGTGERKNAMSLNWATQVSSTPKQLGIAVSKTALTHQLIDDDQAFALNIIPREERAVVRKFVKPAEYDAANSTLNGFQFHAEATGAPVLDLAAAYLDCELRQTVDVGDHSLFIGEVVAAGFSRPEDTLVLRMEDTRMNYGG